MEDFLYLSLLSLLYVSIIIEFQNPHVTTTSGEYNHIKKASKSQEPGLYMCGLNLQQDFTVQEAKKINKGNLAKYINKFLHSVTML
jgi:hypothetical protein